VYIYNIYILIYIIVYIYIKSCSFWGLNKLFSGVTEQLSSSLALLLWQKHQPCSQLFGQLGSIDPEKNPSRFPEKYSLQYLLQSITCLLRWYIYCLEIPRIPQLESIELPETNQWICPNSKDQTCEPHAPRAQKACDRTGQVLLGFCLKSWGPPVISWFINLLMIVIY
jgi:hypothetical protein